VLDIREEEFRKIGIISPVGMTVRTSLKRLGEKVGKLTAVQTQSVLLRIFKRRVVIINRGMGSAYGHAFVTGMLLDIIILFTAEHNLISLKVAMGEAKEAGEYIRCP